MTTMLDKMAEAIGSQMAEDDNDNIDIARAALQAIREPDDVRRLLGQLRGNGTLDREADDGQTWTVLVDAILSEEKA